MDYADNLQRFLYDELFVDAEPDDIQLDDGLRAQHGLDSLGFLELRVHCEALFAISIPEEDFTPENFRTLHTILEYAHARQAQGN